MNTRNHPSVLGCLLLGILLSLGPIAVLAADKAELGRELRLAAAIDDVETMEKLLDQGADVNAANKYGKTALMMAAENGNLAAVSLLLARGADVNRKTVADCTALTLAAENGEPEVTALLIERGADLEARTRAGTTPL
ncbi:MAG TPA: ankyrin repeat domain-containing protein, partial [Chromatiaceae bacterium]|nr:ankyrin repeat domain-containing protein [Chromatiaceae bacterium]